MSCGPLLCPRHSGKVNAFAMWGEVSCWQEQMVTVAASATLMPGPGSRRLQLP